MKKTLFILSIMFTMLLSCTDGGGILETKKCWLFSMKIVASSNYAGQHYSQTTYSTVTKCGLTASEAKNAAKDMEGTTTTTTNGVTATATITVTYSETTE